MSAHDNPRRLLAEYVAATSSSPGHGRSNQDDDNTMTNKCTICTDDHPARETAIHNNDGILCRRCLTFIITRASDQEYWWPARFGRIRLFPEHFRNVLGSKLVETYQEKSREYGIPTARRIYCVNRVPAPGTNTASEAKTVLCEAFVGVLVAEDAGPDEEPTRSCDSCGCVHCRYCAAIYEIAGARHLCDPNKRQNEDTQAFSQLVRGKDYQICPQPSCRRKIELEDGCNHTVCVCGMSLCFICGQYAKEGSDHWIGSRRSGGCPRYNHPSDREALWDMAAVDAPPVAENALHRPAAESTEELERRTRDEVEARRWMVNREIQPRERQRQTMERRTRIEEEEQRRTLMRRAQALGRQRETLINDRPYLDSLGPEQHLTPDTIVPGARWRATNVAVNRQRARIASTQHEESRHGAYEGYEADALPTPLHRRRLPHAHSTPTYATPAYRMLSPEIEHQQRQAPTTTQVPFRAPDPSAMLSANPPIPDMATGHQETVLHQWTPTDGWAVMFGTRGNQLYPNIQTIITISEDGRFQSRLVPTGTLDRMNIRPINQPRAGVNVTFQQFEQYEQYQRLVGDAREGQLQRVMNRNAFLASQVALEDQEHEPFQSQRGISPRTYGRFRLSYGRGYDEDDEHGEDLETRTRATRTCRT